jgi:diacylglycerol kinase (ATP)
VTTPPKTALIANPAARGGWIGQQWHALSGRLRANLGDVELRLTERVGHGAILAQELIAAGCDTLISFGGDGTHSEICHGIMKSGRGRQVALGILHAGTGGDFRRMIEDSHDFDKSCALIKKRPTHLVDVGWVQYVTDAGETADRYFLNITSLGMSGLVDRFVAESKIRARGTAAYLLATLRAQARYKPAQVVVHVDGESHGPYDISAVCVCNGRWAGGGMMFAPEASLADGLFDVIVIKAASTLRGLPVMAGLYKGNHVKSSLVDTFRGKDVQVDVLKNRAWMDIDGEAPGVAPAEFRIHEGAIHLIGVRAEFTSK